MNCMKKHMMDCKDKTKIDLIYKYEEKDLKKFIERVENRIAKKNEIGKITGLKINNPQKELTKSRVKFKL